MLEKILLQDNECTVTNNSYIRTHNRVYELDSMKFIYPKAQDLSTSNRFDPLDTEKTQEKEYSKNQRRSSEDSNPEDNEDCRKNYNSSNNIIVGPYNQISKVHSGCTNKNVSYFDYSLCFNKSPLYNKLLNDTSNNNSVKSKRPNQNKVSNINSTTIFSTGNNKTKLCSKDNTSTIPLDTNAISFSDRRSGTTTSYATMNSDLGNNFNLRDHKIINGDTNKKLREKSPITTNQNTGAIPKVGKNTKTKRVALKTYAMVAAPTAVTIAPKHNKALDNNAMTSDQVPVTMAPKNKNKQSQQKSSRAVVPVEAVAPAKEATAEASTTAIITFPSQNLTNTTTTVTRGDPPSCANHTMAPPIAPKPGAIGISIKAVIPVEAVTPAKEAAAEASIAATTTFPSQNITTSTTFVTRGDPPTRVTQYANNNNCYDYKTPIRKTQRIPKKLKYIKNSEDQYTATSMTEEVPPNTDLEFLLLNTRKIDASKVQAVIDKFLKGGVHKTIFCFTETWVDSLNFTPVGIKLYEKNRGKKDKRGGGLMIGHKLSNKIKLEEVKVDNVDILALEGTIENQKHRIILSYFDSSKKKSGKEYDNNRKIQKDIENLMEVEPDVKLICLGDFNGRLKKLEPNTITDTNGQMIENWSIDKDLQHLNTHENCVGKYTFTSLNGKSAIDHVLVNNNLMNDFIGMFIDEGRIQLGISDHNLIRVWFTMKHKNTKWKNNSSKKTIEWVGKDSKSLIKFEEAFEKQIGKKTGFRRCIDKMKYTLNHTMRKRKKIRTSKSNNKVLLAAVWMDEELRDNIKLRSSYSKQWNIAKKNNDQPEKIEEC